MSAEQATQPQVQITFSLDEINQVLNVLGELPAKNTIDLINFIRGRAQEQVNAANAAQSGDGAPQE